MRTRNLALLSLLLAAGCNSAGDPNRPSWTSPRPHALLQSCAMTRESYHAMICPTIYTEHVVRRSGTFIKSFEELRTVLRPIDTREQALAYRRFLGDVEIERDETLKQLQWTTPLDFHDGEKPFYGVYVAADAARWGVARGPVIEVVDESFVITQPSYRMIETIDEDGKAWVLGEGAVELVRETIHRDGRYERQVVRVLETGKQANVHQPPPLL